METHWVWINFLWEILESWHLLAVCQNLIYWRPLELGVQTNHCKQCNNWVIAVSVPLLKENAIMYTNFKPTPDTARSKTRPVSFRNISTVLVKIITKWMFVTWQQKDVHKDLHCLFLWIWNNIHFVTSILYAGTVRLSKILCESINKQREKWMKFDKPPRLDKFQVGYQKRWHTHCF